MKDENLTNIFIVVICVLVGGVIGIWYLMHPCLQWQTVEATCTTCLHESDKGTCLQSESYPCKKKVCTERK